MILKIDIIYYWAADKTVWASIRVPSQKEGPSGKLIRTSTIDGKLFDTVSKPLTILKSRGDDDVFDIKPLVKLLFPQSFHVSFLDSKNKLKK